MNSIIDKARAFIANHTAEPRYGAMDEMVKGLIEHIDEQAALSRAKDAAMEVVKDRAETWARTASEVMGERDEALAMAETAMREGLSECDRLRSIVERVQISARQLDIARASMNDHDRRTLQSLAATDRGELLKELDGAREESRQWNERATTAEEECERLRNELLAMNAVSASNVTDSLCAEPCGECGGKISPVNHSGRVREYRGVMVAYPDGSVIPTCEACGANWITSDISNHVYGSFREQMRAKNPAQPWTPATACEACKGDEVTGCICGMVPGTEPRKHPTEPTREEKQGKRCECFYSTVAINDIRQCVNCGGTR